MIKLQDYLTDLAKKVEDLSKRVEELEFLSYRLKHEVGKTNPAVYTSYNGDT